MLPFEDASPVTEGGSPACQEEQEGQEGWQSQDPETPEPQHHNQISSDAFRYLWFLGQALFAVA